MENVKEYVVTLTAWAIIAGDITVDASSPEEAAKLARDLAARLLPKLMAG